MGQEREITRGEGRLHNKELHNLLPSIHRSEQGEKDWCVTCIAGSMNIYNIAFCMRQWEIVSNI